MKSIISVESPATNSTRKGRGFSKEELVKAKMTIKEAREAGILVDERRKTHYKDNVETLKNIKEDYMKFLAEKEKEKQKAQKENAKARKEAEKRKKELETQKITRTKIIEEEKKKVQDEIAKREAEELRIEEEKLTEEEITELEELESEDIESFEEEEPSEEELLKKLEEDLSETLEEEKAEEIITPEGTKRVVKRVRKKPTTPQGGASTQAEKKE